MVTRNDQNNGRVASPNDITVDIPETLCASVIPKGTGLSGDALLIDCELGIFAVADGSERNPSASSTFLKRFLQKAEDSGLFADADIPFDEAIEKLVELTHGLLKATDYHDATTFSAIVINRSGVKGAAALLHTGDSLVFKVSTNGEGSTTITQLSRTNHLLIGRSPRLFQAEIISLLPEDRIILATDGVSDLALSTGRSVETFLSETITDITPKEMHHDIMRIVDATAIGLDDIGLLCLHPGALIPTPSNTTAVRCILPRG
jgi:serine/threonine protein phosphatase PrpC